MANKLNTIFLRLANRPIGFLHNTPSIKNYTTKAFRCFNRADREKFLCKMHFESLSITHGFYIQTIISEKSSMVLATSCQSMFSPPSYWTYRWSRCKSEVSFKTSNYITQFLLAQVKDTFCTHCSSQNPKMCLPWICIIVRSKFVIPIAGSKFRSFQ